MKCASCDCVVTPQARFCSSCGARISPTVAVEERKLVTVVFCDLVGSTALSEALDPETLRSVTLRYFAAMRESIEHFGGTVEKFIGDAVMAVFGVPAMHEDDAHRAVAAASGMLDRLAGLNAELASSPGVRLQVRIGVNTGPAVTSTDVSTRQALVSGETVNVAARLEQNAAAGEILIGPLTRRTVGPAVRTEPVGPLRLKGKEMPVIAYRLLGVGEDAPELMRRFDLPFVGRTAERAELDGILDEVAAGRGSRLVAVYGEPGIGKTRLARVWLDGLTRPFALGAGRCRPYGDDGSLAPLAEAVRRLLADRPGYAARPADAHAVLDAGLLRDGTPGPSIDATCAALARVLAAVSREGPVILVVDDCHWAGDPLLEVLDRLVRLTADAAVLVVCLARLDLLDRCPALGSPRSRSLVLSGLSDIECETMVATLAEVGAHLAPGAVLVPEAAGGNPFHIEQLLAAASEADGADDLPPTLQALLGARIDALDRPDRTALDLAAVLGREFASGHLAALAHAGPEGGPGGPLATDAGTDPVRAALTRLGRRRMVEPAGSPVEDTAPLRFSNGLIHEATYRAMAKRTRADRHQRAAEVLAASTSAPMSVAGHLEHAYRYRAELGLLDPASDAVRRQAAGLLTAAGSRALTRSDLAWAAGALRRAVDLFAVGEPGWATAARQLGEVQIATGHGAEGLSLLRAVIRSGSDPVETAHARLALAVADGGAESVAGAVLPVFQSAGDELGQARARIRMGQQHQLHGRHARADELLRMGLAHAMRCDAEPERALALGAVGVSLWRGPTPVPAAVAQCRQLLAEHGGPRPVVRVTLNCPLAVLLALDEQWDEARSCLAEARGLVDELGYVEGGAVLPIFGAAVESLAGRPRLAHEFLGSAAEAARNVSAHGLLSTVTREAARLLLDHGDADEAAIRLARIGAAPDLLRSDLADLDGLRARLAAERGSAATAIDLAERAVSAAAGTDSPIVQAGAALDQAIVFERLGRPDRAVRAAEAAYRRFRGKGHLPGVRRASKFQTRLGAADIAPAEGVDG